MIAYIKDYRLTGPDFGWKSGTTSTGLSPNTGSGRSGRSQAYGFCCGVSYLAWQSEVCRDGVVPIGCESDGRCGAIRTADRYARARGYSPTISISSLVIISL